jgi:hypothetical protein
LDKSSILACSETPFSVLGTIYLRVIFEEKRTHSQKFGKNFFIITGGKREKNKDG